MAEVRRFVLFELNEVPLRVAEYYADNHPQSAFAKILMRGDRWNIFTSDEGHLSPWITWPTLHRGVDSKEHHIVALGQDRTEVDEQYPPVWELLARAGRRVGVFGSLHSYPLPSHVDRYAFYVPDTFAAGPETHPAELSAFQSFNLDMVDRSGRNVSNELPVKQGLSFLLRSLPAGIRPHTLMKIGRQLVSERVWRHRTTRRRTIQSLLAFDLFLAQLQSNKPDASFFFTNHVASAMHRYWPATFTEDYETAKWSDTWVQRFSGEISYAMAEADEMLAEMLTFADRNPDFLILVSGSMGQAAVDDPRKQVKTEVLLRDMSKFLATLGVEGGWKRRRTMEPTYTLAFDEDQSAERFMAAIADVKVAGRPIKSRRLDENGIEFVLGQNNIPDAELMVTIRNRTVEPAEVGLANVLIDDEVGSAAYHVPEGMLLAYDPRRHALGTDHEEIVPTTRIAPTLLALQGVEVPTYMERPIYLVATTELDAA